MVKPGLESRLLHWISVSCTILFLDCLLNSLSVLFLRSCLNGSRKSSYYIPGIGARDGCHNLFYRREIQGDSEGERKRILKINFVSC